MPQKQILNQFVEYQKNKPITPLVKLIAFYLPQFHPFPENDEWWGKGFTEWTNVGKARPNYIGHYQPHCPIHHGYYDLRVPQVMEEQAKLAKEYGIYGFSYYFYWFGGRTLMDTPLELMLANKKVDIPFCVTWANENWTRRWDGQHKDILIAQNHSNEDSLAFVRHLVKYFKDERYIRIDGKPALIIYRADIIPNMAATANIWRDELLKHGFPGLYLISAQSFGIRSPEPFDFDASVEFPPHTAISTNITNELELVNMDYRGRINSYGQVVENAVLSKEPDYKLYRTAMLSWDNTARKQNNSIIFHYFSLLRYRQWLSSIANKVYSNQKYSLDEKIVFVNAWNEWAEGTHLEPDQKFGYGYLQTTYDVLQHYDSSGLGLPVIEQFFKDRDNLSKDSGPIEFSENHGTRLNGSRFHGRTQGTVHHELLPVQHGKNSVYLYQIAYSDETWNSVPANLLPLDNRTNERPDWAEYWPIRRFLQAEALDENAFYGFLSPRHEEKLNVSPRALVEFVSSVAPEVDVVTFSPYFDLGAVFRNVFEQGEYLHPGLMDLSIQVMKEALPGVDLTECVNTSADVVFCNYFAAKPGFWREWSAVCERVFAMAESPVHSCAAALNRGYFHRDDPIPAKVFVIERIASLLLSCSSEFKTENFVKPTVSGFFGNVPFTLLTSLDELKLQGVQEYPQLLNAFHHIQREILSTEAARNVRQHYLAENLALGVGHGPSRGYEHWEGASRTASKGAEEFGLGWLLARLFRRR